MSFYAGHSTAGKLQVLTGGLQTRWMLQDVNNAPWKPVVWFTTEPPNWPKPAQQIDGQVQVAALALAGAQLPWIGQA